MNALVTLEIARHEQEARVRRAMHLRALKAYQRSARRYEGCAKTSTGRCR